ncbi:hypothetical protein ACP26L_36405 (plasmid) [Paenibacillus sp. S-38]|uniref:hypothetical protein n=1 Tax=Paenibacillus sp. S-38 TaxID=3416710 RepID=UPI003CE77010
MPNVQRVHLDKALTNISIGYKNESYIADQIFKPVGVAKQSDKYYVYGMESFRLHNDLRSPGTEANEIDWTFSNDQYFTEGHALRTAIPDEVELNADEVFNLEADGTSLIMDGILQNKEYDAANTLLNPANYAPELQLTLGTNGTLKWSDPNSDPRLDIVKAKSAMHKKAGIRPNTLIISESVLNVLLMHPKLAAMVQYVQTPVLSIEQLKTLLGVQNILVGSAMFSTSNLGQVQPGSIEPLGYIWGNSAVLAYIAPTAGKKTVSIGYSFNWSKAGQGTVQTRKWYEVGRKATVIETEYFYAHKMISQVAGFLFADAVVPFA